MDINQFLTRLTDEGGSDLHILSGDPPRIRLHGELQTISDEKLAAQDVLTALQGIMTLKARELLEAEDNADFAYVQENGNRFRVNAFRHINGVGAIFRAIPSDVITLESLNMPPVMDSVCRQRQGMILVTGKTGSGKSTTLAAMVDVINRNQKGHILTIEDPIEFAHTRKKCLVSQREVSNHTHSFAHALHSALREDPDVILVGELRDLETMGLAVTAAETGILVLGTLHTNSAASTVDRVINTFPVNKQPHIRTMLSTSLRAVVSQQLLRVANGKGRAAAVEILINTPAVANLIREGKTDQLDSVIQSGGALGMQSMDTALHQLIKAGTISAQSAFEAANDKGQFTQYLRNKQ